MFKASLAWNPQKQLKSFVTIMIKTKTSGEDDEFREGGLCCLHFYVESAAAG